MEKITDKTTEKDVKPSFDTQKIADQFANLISENSTEKQQTEAYQNLESILRMSGFSNASQEEVYRCLQDSALLCRSEKFSRVIDLIANNVPIEVKNKDARPNMCYSMSGKGFRVAMNEGFSGKDVAGLIKSVIMFKQEAITEKENIPKDSPLWETKRETAEVSFAGSGEIKKDDVRMISFRMPKKFFPNELLTEEEDENKVLPFIVRHYLQ